MSDEMTTTKSLTSLQHHIPTSAQLVMLIDFCKCTEPGLGHRSDQYARWHALQYWQHSNSSSQEFKRKTKAKPWTASPSRCSHNLFKACQVHQTFTWNVRVIWRHMKLNLEKVWRKRNPLRKTVLFNDRYKVQATDATCIGSMLKEF